MWVAWASTWRSPRTSSASCRSRASSLSWAPKFWEPSRGLMGRLTLRESIETRFCIRPPVFGPEQLQCCAVCNQKDVMFQSGGCSWREEWDPDLWRAAGLYRQTAVYPEPWSGSCGDWAGQQGSYTCQQPLPDQSTQVPPDGLELPLLTVFILNNLFTTF